VRLGVEAAVVDGSLLPGDVEIVGDTIADVGLPSANGRGIAAPGFVDLQVNGFGGVDFLEADSDGYRRAGEVMVETGVTAYLPTFITAPEEQLIAALHQIPRTRGSGPRILGAHLEGPFLASGRLGTHRASARRDPDVDLLDRLLAAGPVRMMTLAPELPGAELLIDLLQLHGVVVSCGHSDASADEANAAFDRGVRTVTHLFNAMRPFRHRDPGIVGAALARNDVVVQIILDGIHLAPETASVISRGAVGRVALVTDAVAGAGMEDGVYSLAGFAVEIRGNVVSGPDGVLAGSVLTMIEAVQNFHALDIPLAAALDAASGIPAAVLGDNTVGRLGPGLPADIVVVDDNLELERVLVAGEVRVAA
jgi:N-acetylglucosamine-6-phosphate deacetylase